MPMAKATEIKAPSESFDDVVGTGILVANKTLDSRQNIKKYQTGISKGYESKC